MRRKGEVGRTLQLRLFPCRSRERRMTHIRAVYPKLSETGPFSLGSKWISQLCIPWVAGKFVVMVTLPLREVCLHKLSASVPTPSYLRRRGQASPFLIYNSEWGGGITGWLPWRLPARVSSTNAWTAAHWLHPSLAPGSAWAGWCSH